MRQADPWTDTDVIDSVAPRYSQAAVALMSFAGIIWQLPLLWGLMALQLLLGLTLGRRWCLPCLFYFIVVQARIGEGPLEDSRPPRTANIIGLILLTLATVLFVSGAVTAAIIVAALVGTLASLASLTGFCLGCQMYRLVARWQNIHTTAITQIDPDDFNNELKSSENYIQFTHPLCADCREYSARLKTKNLLLVDVRQRPDLAYKYHVHIVPTVIQVDQQGQVINYLAP